MVESERCSETGKRRYPADHWRAGGSQRTIRKEIAHVPEKIWPVKAECLDILQRIRRNCHEDKEKRTHEENTPGIQRG